MQDAEKQRKRTENAVIDVTANLVIDHGHVDIALESLKFLSKTNLFQSWKVEKWKVKSHLKLKFVLIFCPSHRVIFILVWLSACQADPALAKTKVKSVFDHLVPWLMLF
jgi:hypothetical protein